MIRCCLILTILLCFIQLRITAQRSELVLESKTQYDLSHYFSYLVDSTALLTVEEVMGQNCDATEEGGCKDSFFGYTDYPVWAFFDLRNESSHDEFVLSISHGTLSDVELYLTYEGRFIKKLYAGSDNFSRSQFKTYVPKFRLNLIRNGRYRIYLRVQSQSSVYIPGRISALSDYYMAEKNHQHFILLIIGGILFLALSNLFVFWAIHERAYLFLGLGLVGASFYFFLFYGFLSDFNIYISTTSLIKARLIAFQVSFLLVMLFSIKYLNIEREDKIASVLMAFVVIIFSMFLVSTVLLWAPLRLLNFLSANIYPIGAVVLIFVGIAQFRKSKTASIVFFVAHFTFFLCVVFYYLVLSRTLKYSFVIYHITLVGVFLYSLILTFSLNLRIGWLSKEIERTHRLEQLSRRLQDEIESRISAEIELRELNQSKDKFLSIIAHDLKNPFNAILGFGQLLNNAETRKDDSKVERYVKQIIVAAQRSYKLLEDLLTWSRAQAGAIMYTPVETDLCKLGCVVIEGLTPIAEHKDITIKFDCIEECMIEIDSNMIETVLRNLISNALKFTHENGLITVRIQDYASDVVVSVVDNGVGMTEEQIEKLFDVNNSTSTRGTANESGTGLGLLVCKEFIVRHGGTMWVESEKDSGSSFYFLIPRSP